MATPGGITHKVQTAILVQTSFELRRLELQEDVLILTATSMQISTMISQASRPSGSIQTVTDGVRTFQLEPLNQTIGPMTQHETLLKVRLHAVL